MPFSKVLIAETPVRVEMGELAVSFQAERMLVSYALGSCVGLAVFDSSAGVGGLAHIQLPNSANHRSTDTLAPWAFANLAVPELFNRCYTLGAKKSQLKVVLAGGAALSTDSYFEIGKKNLLMVKKLLWHNGVFVHAERTGGTMWRTLQVHIGTGAIRIKTQSSEEVF